MFWDLVSHLPLFYMHSSVQFSLVASVRILGHLFGVFVHHFDPKIIRTVEKGCGSYLMLHKIFKKEFGGLFFSLNLVSSFSHLLSNQPSRFSLLPCFWFFSSSLSLRLTQLSRKTVCRLVVFSFSP